MVGAGTTVFGVVNALWLRPLPFDDPERLVWIANGSSDNLSKQAVQVGHVVDLREQSATAVAERIQAEGGRALPVLPPHVVGGVVEPGVAAPAGTKALPPDAAASTDGSEAPSSPDAGS